MAAQGLRVAEDGQLVPVEDSERQGLRQRGVRLVVMAAGLALVLTAAVLLLT